MSAVRDRVAITGVFFLNGAVFTAWYATTRIRRSSCGTHDCVAGT